MSLFSKYFKIINARFSFASCFNPCRPDCFPKVIADAHHTQMVMPGREKGGKTQDRRARKKEREKLLVVECAEKASFTQWLVSPELLFGTGLDVSR